MSDQPPHYATFAKDYKPMPRPAYVIAYLNVFIIILVALAGAYGMFMAGFSGSVMGVVFGAIGLYVSYLAYKVNTTAIDCNNLMLGYPAVFPNF